MGVLRKRGEAKGSAGVPEAVCGGVGREKITVANGNHALRDGVTGTGSPVMGPKTLPGSESHTGKT
jgi:hypothetical protein